MRLKHLFTVPQGEKVTEKVFGRVLLSSICGILLCMACLASTTWAWFTVSIENEGNEIQIATVKSVVEVIGAEGIVAPAAEAGYLLNAGTYTINVRLENDATAMDDLNRPKGTVYVVMIITHEGTSQSYYFTFNGAADEVKVLEGFQVGNGTAVVSFSASWLQPVSAAPIGSDAIVIGEPAEPVVTDPTDPSTEPPADDPTDPSTEPPADDPTDPSTEPPADDPADPSGDPPADDPTDPSGDPPTDDPADPSGDPPADDPADPSGDPPADDPADPSGDPPADAPADPSGDPSVDVPIDPAE